MPLITPTAYFPPADWFAAAVRAGEWHLEAYENYQRKGYRNRAYIAGPNGKLTLSVPLVKGKNQRQPIREVTISDDENWRREHVASIQSAYGRSPFFEFYGAEIIAALQQEEAHLFDYNKSLITSVIYLLDLPIKLIDTTEFSGVPQRPVAPALAPYPQVFSDRHGFRGGLSVLDALFCLGPSFASHPLVLGADAGAVRGPDSEHSPRAGA